MEWEKCFVQTHGGKFRVQLGGYDIQKYLEHKVVPEGYLRFALTCRTVLENHLKPDERPNYIVEEDEHSGRGRGGGQRCTCGGAVEDSEAHASQPKAEYLT